MNIFLKNKDSMKYILVIIFTLFIQHSTSAAFNVITLNDHHKKYDVAESMSYFIDSTSVVTIDQMLDVKNEFRFHENKKSPVNLGVSKYPHWFVFEVSNQLHDENWMLEINYPTLNWVTFYFVNAQNEVDTIIYSGISHLDDRGKSYNYSIVLNLPFKNEQAYRVFIHVKTESYIILPTSIMASKIFFEKNKKELTFLNVLYGIFLAFILLNLILYLLTFELNYLLLTLYLTTLLFNAYYLSGFGFNLMPWLDVFYLSRIRNILFGLGSFFFLIFAINYLELRKYKTFLWINLFLLVVSAIYIAAVFLPQIPQRYFTNTSPLLFIAGACFNFYAGVFTYFRGEKLALYYIISFIFITVSSVIYMLTLNSLLPFTLLSFNVNLLGTIMFGILLTLGLIEKITAIKQERLKSGILESTVVQLNNEIDERKKVEDALRESEGRFRLLFEMSPQPISLTEVKSGRIIDINRQMEEFLGYTKDEVLNKNSVELNIIDAQRRSQLIGKLKTDGYVSGFELKIRHKSGEISDGLAYMRVINMMGLDVLVSVFIDVTEKKQKEEQLIESEKELRELNASKDKFFSIVGHDLMNPFNAMMGFVQLLIESSTENDKEKCTSYLMLIDQSAKRIFNLLQNLLMWSKTQSRKLSFTPGHINVVELLMNAIDIQKSEAHHKQIEIVPVIEAVGNVYVDQNMISVVIRNLVSNAIKFSEKGSKVFIKFEKDEENYHFSVTDQGAGIDAEKLKVLFENFDNITLAAQKEIKLGLGLGLILCKEFVRIHKGQIWAESEPGKGSTFYFSIPITPDHR